MKRLIVTILAAGALTSASAQSVIPNALGGALLGTVIGGIAGGNCHNGGFSGNGAAIGAGIGLAAGAVLGEVQQQSAYNSQPCYYASAPVYAQPVYGYVYPPAYTYAPAPAPAPPQPNYAVGGALTGALAGGLIGTGYGNGWEGAGIGAASGLVVGSLAEYGAEKQEQKVAAAQTAPLVWQPAVQADPPGQTSTSQVAPMPQAYRPAANPGWDYQIPDAPRVPDAPTF